jgi:hypothetical protein
MRLAALLLALLLAKPAFADCERDRGDVAEQAKSVTDINTRARIEHLLVRADREIAEGDEFDCSIAVAAAMRLMPGAGVGSDGPAVAPLPKQNQAEKQ